VLAVGVVVDGIGLGLTHDAAIEDIACFAEAELLYLFLGELYEIRIA